MREEPTREEYLSDFRERCHEVAIKDGNLEEVEMAVLRGECPFLGCGFTRNGEFRRMRRYYRNSPDDLTFALLKILVEVGNGII